jgi:hypothetical protein
MGLRLVSRLLWAVRFGDSPQGSDCASNGTNVAANELSPSDRRFSGTTTVSRRA